MKRFGLGFGAVVVGVVVVGAVLVGVGLQDRRVALSPGPNSFVNADRPGLDAHNSPAVVAHPDRPEVLVVADRIDTPRFSCSVSISTNAGLTWRALPLPLPPGAPNCHGPDVAFDGSGDLLVLFGATGGRFNQPVGVWLQRITDPAGRGTPEGEAVPVAGGEAFHSRLVAAGDRVLVTWVQAQASAAEVPLGFPAPPNPVLVARSEDGGRTFSAPVQVSEDDRLVIQPTVILGPGGEVVVGALDLGEDRLDYQAEHQGQGGAPSDEPWRVVTWTSRDGGSRFEPAAVVADGLVAPRRIIVNLGPSPSFALDPERNRVYASWDAGRGDERDVFLAHSDDGGTTWSRPEPVSPRPSAQFLPAVGVAPGGRVDVVFYDRSGDPGDVMAEVVVASSWDGGASFVTSTVSDVAFDSSIGFGSAQGIPLLGSQLAVLSLDDRLHAFWADTSRGSTATNIQDLATAEVEVLPAAGPRWPLVVVG
ncbi:MAG: glycoside hydrolase, partial [Actinomycetota bacterium]|nr:glycoside hydrolase [Actinomycetota bacterium]